MDEDELRRGGDIIGTFQGELEGKIQAVDRKVNGDLAAAMRGQAGPAFVSAWNANRSQNLQRMLDILEPVPAATDIAAGVILGLKIKVIADVTLKSGTATRDPAQRLFDGTVSRNGPAGAILDGERSEIIQVILEKVE